MKPEGLWSLCLKVYTTMAEELLFDLAKKSCPVRDMLNVKLKTQRRNILNSIYKGTRMHQVFF
jgi:hypothetical protein